MSLSLQATDTDTDERALHLIACVCEQLAELDHVLSRALVRVKPFSEPLYSRLLTAHEGIKEARKAMCVEDAPPDRPTHVHSADCRECGCQREGLEVERFDLADAAASYQVRGAAGVGPFDEWGC